MRLVGDSCFGTVIGYCEAWGTGTEMDVDMGKTPWVSEVGLSLSRGRGLHGVGVTMGGQRAAGKDENTENFLM